MGLRLPEKSLKPGADAESSALSQWFLHPETMASDKGGQLSGLLQQLLRAFSGLVLYALEEGALWLDQRDLTFVIPTHRLRDVGAREPLP